MIGAAALLCVSAFAFQGTPAAGQFTDAGATATGLQHYLGSPAGGLFAIVLLNASLIGAGALTLSTSYAFGDVFGTHSSLHRKFADAKLFYGMFTAMIAAAAAIVLIPGAPLGVITESVQALAGVLLPSASVFLLLLCNDPEVLGPWRNPGWLNVLASVIVAILVLLSLILMATTVFPNIDVTKVALIGGALLAIGLLAFGLAHPPLQTRHRGGRHGRDGSQDSKRAMDDAAARAPGPAAMVDRPQDRDAHPPRLPRRRDDPAAHQSHTTRRRITRAAPPPGLIRARHGPQPGEARTPCELTFAPRIRSGWWRLVLDRSEHRR